MLFQLVRLHIYHAMDNTKIWDCPAFLVNQGAQPEGKPKEPDTLYVIDGSRAVAYFVLAHPGEGEGQYTVA